MRGKTKGEGGAQGSPPRHYVAPETESTNATKDYGAKCPEHLQSAGIVLHRQIYLSGAWTVLPGQHVTVSLPLNSVVRYGELL